MMNNNMNKNNNLFGNNMMNNNMMMNNMNNNMMMNNMNNNMMMNNNMNKTSDFLSAQIFQISHQSENQSNMNYQRSSPNSLFNNK